MMPEDKPMTAPYSCPYCGAPAWRHPHDIDPPVDYCHEDAHGRQDEALE